MAGPILVDGVPMHSIRQINGLPEEPKTEVYGRLIPDDLLAQFGIDPDIWTDAGGMKLVFTRGTLVTLDIWFQFAARFGTTENANSPERIFYFSSNIFLTSTWLPIRSR